MALPPEYDVGLRLYGLREITSHQRTAAWLILEPHLPEIADGLVGAFAANLPAIAAQLQARRADHVRSIVASTKALFLSRYDDAWLATVTDRVAYEIRSGLDMRSRSAVNAAILTALNAILRRRRHFGARRVMETIDVATRILAHDAALAAGFHYAAKVREARTTGKALTAALGQFDTVTRDVRQTVLTRSGSLRATAHGLLSTYATATEEADRAMTASVATEQHVSSAVASTESLSGAIDDLSRISASCATRVQDAAAHMSAVKSTIGSLSDAVARIGTVVDVIADVARHTNLLALNATIEAARAGDAGRGFAVVAGEVKDLATQTSSATAQIADLIRKVQDVTGHAVAGIDAAGRQVEAITSDSLRLAQAVGAQTETAEGIARAAAATATTATDAKAAMVNVSNSIETTKETAVSMSNLSEDLDRQMQALHAAIDTLFQATGPDGSFRPLVNILKKA